MPPTNDTAMSPIAAARRLAIRSANRRGGNGRVWRSSYRTARPISRPRRHAEETPRPDTQRRGHERDDEKPGIGPQMRPFLDDPPEMDDREQSEQRAGGDQIRLHTVPSAVRGE